MSRLKKILIGVAVTLLTVVALFLLFVGPWPVYSDSKFEDSRYYAKARAGIEAGVSESEISESPGRLMAGWATSNMTPPVGTPMAGYSARPDGKRSTGVRDELFARAIAFSDGRDTAVLLGSDMLIIPPNIAALAREQVSARTPLTPNDILFNCSHTHCGPGGFGPGLASKITGGEYDPSIPGFIAGAFADAIVAAYEDMKPAKLAHGGIDAPQLIRNRARSGAPIDSELSFLVAEQDGGRRCCVMSFSGHPTIFGTRMMEFSAEYPGEFMRYVERATGATAVYLGGALGSMSTRAPKAPTASAKVEAMGVALGKLIVEGTKDLEFETELDVVSVGTELGNPAPQIRPLSPKWRMSPYLATLLRVPTEGWIQGVRIGNIVFAGLPFDLSGEISQDWKAWADERGQDLWALSFCAAYSGYLSPDKYYMEVDKSGHLGYEVGLMSWCGPNAEAYYTALVHHMCETMTPRTQQADRKL